MSVVLFETNAAADLFSVLPASSLHDHIKKESDKRESSIKDFLIIVFVPSALLLEAAVAELFYQP